ncbi:MAG: flavin-nucleotide-binding protein [Acidimicrobiaceae bacterium]|nr:flavin-nucleotide-binding protein [Acidimicrobiaceae bacterium]
MSGRTELRRAPDRAVADSDAIHAALDEGLIAHVGLIAGSDESPHPVVIPMLYARDGDRLYLHGSPASRLLRTAKKGSEVCVTVTLLDALVLARSGLHHSMNYRSVVVMGTAVEVVDPDEKVAALDRLVDHTIPGRVAAIRPAHEAEVKTTTVLVLPLDECSMKVRSGPPIDDEEDMDEEAWAGLIPLGVAVGDPVPDDDAGDDPVPEHVADWARGPGMANGRGG